MAVILVSGRPVRAASVVRTTGVCPGDDDESL